jgi:hypothetical protein
LDRAWPRSMVVREAPDLELSLGLHVGVRSLRTWASLSEEAGYASSTHGVSPIVSPNPPSGALSRSQPLDLRKPSPSAPLPLGCPPPRRGLPVALLSRVAPPRDSRARAPRTV